MKISHKLFLSLSVLTIITIAIIGSAFFVTNNLGKEIETLVEEDMVFVSDVKQIFTQGLLRRSALSVIILTPSDKMAPKTFAKSCTNVLKLMDKLVKNAPDYNAEKEIKDLQAITIALIKEQKKVQQLAHVDMDLAVATSKGQSLPKWRKIKKIYFPLEKKISESIQQKVVNQKDKIKQFKIFIIGMFSLYLLLVGFTLFVFKYSIIAPINNLVESFKKSSTPDEKQNYSISKLKINSNDEIGELSKAFNHLLDQINILISEISGVSNELTDYVDEVNNSISQAAEGTEHIAVNASQISGNALVQSENMNQASEELKDNNVKIETIFENTNKSLEISSNTETNAKKGEIEIQSAVAKVNQIKSTTSEISVQINELGELNISIENIVDLIKAIAAQTNLLALNAAIEAARAGDAGKGFAVVADEVKKLAEESSKATENISEIVKEIQSKTNNAVQKMNDGVIEVEDGVQIIEKVKEALADISQASFETKLNIEDVNKNMNELLDSSQTVTKSMQDVSDITKNTTISIEEIASASEEQSASMTEITQNSATLSKASEKLNDQISKFNIG